MLADRSEDAPADSIKWAKDLYRTRAVEKPAGIVHRIMAVIAADLAPGTPAFGERSGEGGQARQMLFEAGDNAVDLRITPADGKFEVRGQILGEGFENAQVALSAGEVKISTQADSASGFSFNAVRAGKYDMTITLETAEIVVERLDIK